MIQTDNLVQEMLGVIGYAAQTLELHPDKKDKVTKYLRSERDRLALVIKERDENFDILRRVVVY
jgi:hypothetical protein